MYVAHVCTTYNRQTDKQGEHTNTHRQKAEHSLTTTQIMQLYLRLSFVLPL